MPDSGESTGKTAPLGERERSHMKALFIGGTGRISMAITALAVQKGWEVCLINRGNRKDELPEGVCSIIADINDEEQIVKLLEGKTFDVVCDFIGYVPEQLERDFRLFQGKTDQFIYISSASAYQKPPAYYVINEKTPLENPYWKYSENKIACEEYLRRLYQEKGFPVTIVRPSHTYDERSVPVGVHGAKGSWQVVKRMMEGKPVLVHGDGTSLWTLTHNRDFAKGFLGLMGNPDAIGETYQITSDESLTWNQIYQAVADCLGVEYKPYYVATEFLAETAFTDLRGNLWGDKAHSVVFDNAKLKAAVPDFKAIIPFTRGIKETVDHILSHPECQTEDKEFDEWCDMVITALENAKKEIVKEWFK